MCIVEQWNVRRQEWTSFECTAQSELRRLARRRRPFPVRFGGERGVMDECRVNRRADGGLILFRGLRYAPVPLAKQRA